MSVDELVTGGEIGRRLGISRQMVARMNQDAREQELATGKSRRDAFPPPLGQVGKALVWRWKDVEAWVERVGYTPRGKT